MLLPKFGAHPSPHALSKIVQALPTLSFKHTRDSTKAGGTKKQRVSSFYQVKSYLGSLVSPFLGDDDLASWKIMVSDEKDHAIVRAAAQFLVYSLECAFDAPRERARLESLEAMRKSLIVGAEEILKNVVKEKDDIIVEQMEQIKI